jgi:predicted GTPase
MRQKYGAAEIVDPVPAAIGSLQRIFEGYNHLGRVVPAMCYSNTQIWDLC